MDPLCGLEIINQFFTLLYWLESNYSGAKQSYKQLSLLHLTAQVIEGKFSRLRENLRLGGGTNVPLSERENLLIELAQRVIKSIEELKETVERNDKRNCLIAFLRKLVCGAQWKEQSDDVTLNVILLVGCLNLFNDNKDIKEMREFVEMMVEPIGIRKDILTCIQDEKEKNLIDIWNHTIYTLHSAVKNRNVNEIVKLCKSNPQAINIKNTRSQTPLLIALNIPPVGIETNDETDYIIIQHLLKAGANPNIEDNDGFYPLHRAIRSQKPVSFVQLLLDKGADVMRLNVHKEAPMHLACKTRGNLEYVKILANQNVECIYLEDEDFQTPLYQAVKNIKIDIIEYLVNKGAYDHLGEKSKEDLDFLIKYMPMTTEEECDYVMHLRRLFENRNTSNILVN